MKRSEQTRGEVLRTTKCTSEGIAMACARKKLSINFYYNRKIYFYGENNNCMTIDPREIFYIKKNIST